MQRRHGFIDVRNSWGIVFLFALYLDDLSRLGSWFKGCFVILYADDILLLSPSVSQLEKLLRVYVKGNLLGWIWPLISKSHAVFELVPVATKQLALFIAKPYHG